MLRRKTCFKIIIYGLFECRKSRLCGRRWLWALYVHLVRIGVNVVACIVRNGVMHARLQSTRIYCLAVCVNYHYVSH